MRKLKVNFNIVANCLCVKTLKTKRETGQREKNQEKQKHRNGSVNARDQPLE